MRSLVVKPATRLEGEILLLGDKSIAHRSVIVGSISKGKTIIENFPASEDCLGTIKVFKKLGISIKRQKSTVTLFGNGLNGLKKPKGSLFVGESGTTLRLILGLLAGQNFSVKLVSAKSLSQRPMRRITEPLRMMGAKIIATGIPKAKNLTPNTKSEEYPPIVIKGGKLKPITYKMPVASAQVKSAILLAGLYARGITSVLEPVATRDHTERILKLFKADIKVKQNTIVIKGNRELASPGRVFIPGDISSASFFIVMAVIMPNSEILIRNVSLNPTRIGIIRILKRMGANIKVLSTKYKGLSYEPMGDLLVRSSLLKGVRVKRDEIPSLIDELPVLMVAACFAKGETLFEGVEELHVKETDRIRSMSENLSKMGAMIKVAKTAKREKIIIKGAKELDGAQVRSFSDHRTAMSMIAAGLVARGNTIIDDISCINKSFPGFLASLKKLIP